VNAVAGDLVNTISQPGQLDSADGSGVAVVIFYAYKQQTTIDSQRGEVLCQLRVLGAVAGRQL
jgi:hypothetical protein